MKAVVLAAGEGQRLRPYTSTRPKHMLPVAGTPLLEHMLLSLRTVGVKDVAIVVGYLDARIREYFKDGTRLGVQLTYVKQDVPSGTAAAMAMAEKYVQGEDFIALYGDLLLGEETLSTVLREFEACRSPTISVVPVADPREFGVVTVKKSRVEKIVEKPTGKIESNLINAGVYVFPSDIFRHIEETGKSVRGEYEITDTLQSLLSKGEHIAASQIDPKEWLDIGRPWDLLEANQRVLEKTTSKIEGVVEEGAHLLGEVVVRDGARIRSGAYIEGPVLAGEGCEVGPNCHIRPFTSLGRGTRVGNACEVKNSIIMDGTHIGHLSYVGDSILGENCNLGAGTITANLRLDDGSVKVLVKDRVADSGLRKLGAFLGDDVKTGIGVSIMPGVKIGAGAWIGPAVVVRRDVPEKAKLNLGRA